MKTKLQAEEIVRLDQQLEENPELLLILGTIRRALMQVAEIEKVRGQGIGKEIGRKIGEEIGRNIGEKFGREEGRYSRECEIIQNMLMKRMDISLISELTGIPEIKIIDLSEKS